LSELVQEVIRSLEMAIKGRPIVWPIASLPTVVGDAFLLKQVLTNLSTTAWSEKVITYVQRTPRAPFGG
jgi:light-regulated signal transduction histidine kinase (bacteriophytochrome)